MKGSSKKNNLTSIEESRDRDNTVSQTVNTQSILKMFVFNKEDINLKNEVILTFKSSVAGRLYIELSWPEITQQLAIC
jgi:hypothetical protein